MLKIALLNMPFAAFHLPSLGLTQLKSVLDARFGDAVETRVVYANLELAAFIGLDLYESIASSGEHLQSGFPEWFFRRAAFPDLADNVDEYFARYYPAHDAASAAFRRTILDKRRGIEAALDAVIERHGLDRCDVVGCTSMFFENNVSFAMLRKLKERNPELVTILGGATSESPSGEEFARQVPWIDYVFSGPALVSLPRVVGNLLAGDRAANDIIDGVFSQANQGRGVGPIGAELDIDTPIALDYGPFLDALGTAFPAWEVKAVLPFETSRGCWWGAKAHCTFCGLNKQTMTYRAMRPDLALELIRSLFPYADRASVLMCVDNILQRQYVKEVFPHLDTPAGLAIFYQLKANLTEREVEAMAAAGVKLITPGFESLATSTLRLMDKGVTAFHNLLVMKHCRMHDVHPGWNILVGSPGEGEEIYVKYLDDLPRFVHLPAPQGLFSIHFNRYSPYHVKAAEYGLDLEPLDYYEMVYPFDREAIGNVAYDFADRNLDADYLQALARWIDPVQEQVRHWQRRWRGEDGGLLPSLHLVERHGETRLYDSRDGQAREEAVPATVATLLAHCAEPRRLETLAKELAGLPGSDLERDLSWVRERRLVFEEEEKIMSLVLPHEPPPMTYRSPGLAARRQPRAEPALPPVAPIGRTARRLVRQGSPA